MHHRQDDCGTDEVWTLYLEHQDAATYHFYPEGKHRTYWEQYPWPVVLMLHDADSGLTYWTDARQYLRDPHPSKSAHIPVPKANILQHTTAVRLFETAGVNGDAFISDLKDVIVEMAKRRIDGVAFPQSFFDLFTQGLTLIARSVYYDVGLAMAAAKFNMGLQDLPNVKERTEFDVTLGLDEHNFCLTTSNS